MTNHVAYPGCYCADCVEGTPSARITGDKDRENPVEGAPHTPLGAALIYAQNRIEVLEAENERLRGALFELQNQDVGRLHDLLNQALLLMRDDDMGLPGSDHWVWALDAIAALGGKK